MRVGLEVTGKEIRLAWRRLWRRWTVTLLALVTLALAVGVNTAMFSVFYGLVQHPLPFPHSRNLVWLQTESTRTHRIDPAGASISDVLSYGRRTRTLSAVAGFQEDTCTLLGHGAPQHILYTNITGGFFRALQVRPARGRWLEPRDGQISFPTTVVISNLLWHSYFNADPQALGKKIEVDNQWFTVVGIMPPDFDYPSGSQFWVSWVTIKIPPSYRAWRKLSFFGRLKPNVTLDQAQRDMSSVAFRLGQKYPKWSGGVTLRVSSMASHIAGPIAPGLSLMMIGALLVLGLACANVGNLMLLSALNRWPDIAIQVSLGARRRRLFGQLFAEGLLLAGAAGGLGWLLAWAMVPWVRHWQGSGLPQGGAVSLNLRVLAFAVALAVLMALWFALAPGLELLRPRRNPSLLASVRVTSRRSRLSSVLVIVEVAVTVVLLVGAGLFWQNLQRVRHTAPGFRPGNVLTFRASVLANNHQEVLQQLPYFMHLNQRLRDLPGVRAAGMVSDLPMTTPIAFTHVALIGTAQTSQPAATLPSAGLLPALPGYFRAMGIPLHGRDFLPSDNQPSQPLVVILSQAFAHIVFGARDPIGRSVLLKRSGAENTARVVGVAGDVPALLPGRGAAPTVYMPLAKVAVPMMSVAVLTRGHPLQLAPAIRRLSRSLNPEVALFAVRTMPQRLARVMAPIVYRTNLLAAMAILALLLAAAGLYGVLAHDVAQRRHDIGIRMALGASSQQVSAAVLVESLRLILAGILVGLVVSWWLQGSVQRFLQAAGATVWPWLSVPVLVLAVGLLATAIPAWRAARVDPAVTLRRH